MIRLENVSKTFTGKEKTVEAVRNINLEIKKGEIFGIIGFSGAGKSTLVRLMNLLEVPEQGEVYFKGVNLLEAAPKELLNYRRKIGMIFQQFNLLDQRTVLKNVCYPLEIARTPRNRIRERALELLEIVGLSDKKDAYPSELSGGQKQRVAIARALAANPEVLLCDEATSALDPITTRSILSLIKEINEKYGITVVVITHEMRVVEQICDRVAVMSGGVIEETGSVKDVFLNPRSETGKKLVLPLKTEEQRIPDKKTIRIVFDGESSFEPTFANLVFETGIRLNIMGANTEDINGSAYGQLFIEYPDDEGAEKVYKYLSGHNIAYEVIEPGHDADTEGAKA